MIETKINYRPAEFKYVLKNLPEKSSKILDVGCCESIIPLVLRSLGHEVWAIDINEYPFENEIVFIQGSIIDHVAEGKKYDCIVLYSTVEHIGLDAYGNKELEENGDIMTMAACWKNLADDGTIIITTPWAPPEYTRDWFRVYNEDNIWRLIAGCEVVDFQTLQETGNPLEEEAPGVLFLVLRKKGEKENEDSMV